MEGNLESRNEGHTFIIIKVRAKLMRWTLLSPFEIVKITCYILLKIIKLSNLLKIKESQRSSKTEVLDIDLIWRENDRKCIKAQ